MGELNEIAPSECPAETGEAARHEQPRVLGSIFLYLLIVFVGAALIAPRLHAGVQFLAESHWRLRSLAGQPFYRYVSRSLLVIALVGLPTLLKALKIGSFAAVGFKPGHWAEGWQGFAWGFAALGFAAALIVSSHARAFDLTHSGAEFWHHIRGAAITALIVAGIEEILFRGALFGGLRRQHGFWTAALISSAIYGIVHFFEKPAEPAEVEWFSGLIVLGQMLHGFVEWQVMLPGFLNLVLVGLILCLAYERTGALFFSIGLHGGLIFWVKSFGFLTREVPGASSSLWGSSKLVDGWGAGVLLVCVFFGLNRLLPDAKRQI